MECCVICSKSYGSLMQCKDAESWARFCHVAVIKRHRQILDLSTGEQDYPQSPVYSTKLQVQHRRHCITLKHLGQMKGKKKHFVAPESEH